MRSSLFHRLETVLSKRKLTKFEKKKNCWAWLSNKSYKIFGSRCAKCLKYTFLFENIALKNFRLSCIVSTQDAYYIADTKSMTGARYNSLTCSLLVTNLYRISNRGRSPVDNDECSEGYVVKMNDCHPNASCVNTQGSRNWLCNPTYFGIGSICEGKFVIFRPRDLIMYVLLNVIKEHAEFVKQIFDTWEHKSLSPNTLRNYRHS